MKSTRAPDSRRAALGLSVIAIVVVAAACGGDGEAPAENGTLAEAGTADGSSSGGASSSGEASSSSLSSSSGSMPDADGGSSGPIILKSGTIYMTQAPSGSGSTSSEARVQFFERRCERIEEQDNCSLQVCDQLSAEGPSPPYHEAGIVTVEGVQTYVLEPDPSFSMRYSSASNTLPLWDTTALEVRAAGGSVPAFTVTVPLPTEISLVYPEADFAPLDVDSTQDFTATWDGGGTGEVEVILQTFSETASAKLTCTAPAAGGSGTLRAPWLAKMIRGGGYLNVNATMSRRVQAGEWVIDAMASYPGEWGRRVQVR